MSSTELQSTEKLNIFGKIVYSKFVQGFIIICIVLNSIQLGLDTSSWWRSTAGNFSKVLDMIFIWIFALEIVLKLCSDKHRFFTKGWNIFDFLVVAIAFVPGNGAFSILRVFRIFRALRLLYRIPRLRIITESLFSSIPSIGWICVLLSIWFYICSVIATSLFGSKFPEWFGSIAKSMYSLFQIMTLESWSMGIVRPVMAEYPYAWLLFVPFIIFATYTVMNLFIGIMVSAISDAQNAKTDHNEEEQATSPEEAILAELRTIRSELEELKADNAELKKQLKEK
ncbi:MAG: ion transporter [Lentisphaerae bacterium]|nr:ion transporter [Lentisphaerota bacterium]